MTMDPIVQRGLHPGSLVRVVVPGEVAQAPNPENEVEVVAGAERSMHVYVPASGCPHPKQAQVLMVLADDATDKAVADLMSDLALGQLAERNHAILVFPAPAEGGWNYAQDPTREDDAQFIVRCFALLKGAAGASGFNGMIFHLACTPAASAMAWTLALTRPLDAAAVMVGEFPMDYEPPVGRGAQQAAWLYARNVRAEDYLRLVNAPLVGPTCVLGGARWANLSNPCACYFVGERRLCAASVADAWDAMFSRTRRWRNDVNGTYQPRIDFEERGFSAHVADGSLGLADGLPRTWHEYVPPALRGTSEPAPLVIYLHGVNCVGLYGAEQSGWADIADEEGLLAVFPDATLEERWNVWDDPRLPSDVAYVLALIEHMDGVHPVDRGCVYLSGFSMGSMFANALACSYPQLFAGVVALNGPNKGYLGTLEDSLDEMLAFRPGSVLADLVPANAPVSPTQVLADRQRALGLRMPFAQFVGLEDAVGFDAGRIWPVTSTDDGLWPATVAFWLEADGVEGGLALDVSTPTGIAAHETCEEGCSGRLVHQLWHSADEGAPSYYHLVAERRMPHAVDLEEVRLGWRLVGRWRRNPDGSLGAV